MAGLDKIKSQILDEAKVTADAKMEVDEWCRSESTGRTDEA